MAQNITVELNGKKYGVWFNDDKKPSCVVVYVKLRRRQIWSRHSDRKPGPIATKAIKIATVESWP